MNNFIIVNSIKKNPSLIISSGILVLLVIASFIFPENIFENINLLSIQVRDVFGQFYLILGFLFVVFMLLVGVLPFGKNRLGSQKPVYGFWSWIAMLYSAGMGAGILFRAVQEPVFMFLNPPFQTNVAPKVMALEYTFFQWGFTAWAFYAIFALFIGHLIFNKKQAVQLSGLFPEKLPKSFKISINSLTILATLIGIVSAVAIGVKQIEDSAKLLIDLPNNFFVVVCIVFVIFSLASTSSLLGLDKGIKQVSNFNILLTTFLLVFIFLQTDIVNVLKSFILAFWQYLKDFVPMSLAYGDYNPGKQFLTDWTYYYWAFWLAWAPFTGVFIARISRGRSYRQIVWGSLLVPALASFFWFSVFGSSAIQMIDNHVVQQADFDSAFNALSQFLKQYHWPSFSQIVVLILLFGFLITSLDSGIFVLSMFSDKGKQDPLDSHKIIWSVFCFLVCLSFLYIGFVLPDQDVLSTVSKILIIVSMPFALLSLFMLWRFIKQHMSKK